ncbi:universal stress protein [Streptomyces werraensis]|uniref:universal stress protein n=1 Tax=Streptomyces werraensis TaxID=68284 RepID=UPI003F4DEBCA
MDDQDHIVVGVDGSPSSREALRWAARQAALTGGTVLALTSWDYPQYHGALGWLPPSSGDEEALEARAREEPDPVRRGDAGRARVGGRPHGGAIRHAGERAAARGP